MGLSGELRETAALLLSELVTNALRHGSPPGREIVVTVRRTDGLLRMEVEDAGDTLPRPRTPDPVGECGRGLALVAALADDWGGAEAGAGEAGLGDAEGAGLLNGPRRRAEGAGVAVVLSPAL